MQSGVKAGSGLRRGDPARATSQPEDDEELGGGRDVGILTPGYAAVGPGKGQGR